MNFPRIFLCGALLCLSACGGGGGGGGKDGRGQHDINDRDSFDPPVDNAQSLEYEGTQGAAGLQPDNIGYFIYNLLSQTEGATYLEDATSGVSGDDINFSIAVAPDRNSGPEAPELFRLRAFAFNIMAFKKPGATGNAGFSIAAVSDSYDYADQYSKKCESGSIDQYVMLNDDGTGKIVLDYKDCLEDGELTNGLVTQEILVSDTSDSTPVHTISSFKRLTTTIGKQSFVQSGSFEFERIAEDHERYTMNILYKETNSGTMGWLKDMVSDIRYRDFAGSGNYSESISGRFYDSSLGYVDITTVQRIEYSHNIPIRGELVISGAGGSSVRLEFPGGIGFTVSLDADGDEAYENSVTMSLARLAIEESADIGDDDGDGLHNSWEIFYGLDPSDPDDADLDTDEDSISNRDEYRLGYAPNDDESVPPFSDIGLSASSYNYDNLYPAGHASSYIFILNNDGEDEAGSVSARFTMPPGFSLQSITQWPEEFEGDCEIEVNIVNCEFSDVGPYPARSVQINFILPEIPGNYSYEAAVIHSSLFDKDESNNVISGQIEVRPATAELAASFITTADSVPSSQNFHYIFEVKNTGALPATNVLMELQVPAGISVVESSVDNGCQLTGGVIACSYPTLSPGGRREESIVVTPSGVGNVEAVLTAISDTPEINDVDNTAVQTREIITPVSDLYLRFLSHETRNLVLAGSEWGLQLFPYNDGPHDMPQVLVTLDLPDEIEFVRLEGESVECEGGHPLVCTPLLLPSGYPNFKIFLSSSVPGMYDLPVTISGGGVDPDLSNNSQMISAYVGVSIDPLQAQIDAADPGDTVEVHAGYYLGRLDYAKNINLVAVDGPENTYWAAQPGTSFNGLIIRDTAGGEVTGFTFTQGDTAIRLLNSGVNVHDNIFEKLRTTVMYISGLKGALIERNIMRENICSGAAISPFEQTNPIIRNNLFIDNSCEVIRSNTLGSPSVIMNNNFIGNTTGIVITAEDRNAGAYIGNNIFSGNMVGIKTITDCGMDCPTFQSNLFYNNGANYEDTSGGVNEIYVDPLFTDAANGDFSLQSGSPAIDAGSALNAPADDFEGSLRPVDGDGSTTAEPDIGAYEFQPD